MMGAAWVQVLRINLYSLKAAVKYIRSLYINPAVDSFE